MKIIYIFATIFMLFASSAHSEVKSFRDTDGALLFEVIDANRVEMPNHHRSKNVSPSPRLVFSTVGSTVDQITPKRVGSEYELRMHDASKINFKFSKIANQNITQFDIRWHQPHTKVPNEKPNEICLHLDATIGNHWYAGYASNQSRWPMDPAAHLDLSQFNYLLEYELFSVPRVRLGQGREFSFILEHSFVSSAGFAAHLAPRQPLWIRRNASLLCISSSPRYIEWKNYYLSTSTDPDYVDLRLSFFAASDIRRVTDYLVHESGLIPKPSSLPPDFVFRNPAWRTSECFYHRRLNDPQNITDFVDEIKSHMNDQHKDEFELLISSRALIVHDDAGWHINSKTFPNFTETSAQLHSNGKTRLAALIDSPIFIEALNKSSPLHNLTLRSRGNFATAYLDFSNVETQKYFVDHLKSVIETNRFDSIHLRSYIVDSDLRAQDAEIRKCPPSFETAYIETAARAAQNSSYPSTVSTEFGFKTQHLPIVHRLVNFFSTPSAQLLRELIPNMLSISAVGGFPFVEAYSVGGFHILTHNETDPKDTEPLIRLMQAVTLMPVISFTRIPGHYSVLARNITLKCLSLRAEHLPTIVALARRRVTHGEPIIRPLWYSTPDDMRTYTIGDQFMLGEDIMVAPVIRVGDRSRTVYFPGSADPDVSNTTEWIDQHGKSWIGGTETTILAPLDELPYFMRKI